MSQLLRLSSVGTLEPVAANPALGVPDGIFQDAGGRLWRKVRRMEPRDEDTVSDFVREVAMTQAEAEKLKKDWYHPRLGWLIDGYKLERDRSRQSIIEDVSESIPRDPDLVEQERDAALQRAGK